MAPPDDSPPPWRLGTASDSLSRFTSLLGTFELKEDTGEAKKPVHFGLVPNHEALKKLLVCGSSDEEDDCALSFPSLSLMEEDHHAAVGSEKHQLQARAAQNLSRSLTLDRKRSLPEGNTNSCVESSYDTSEADTTSSKDKKTQPKLREAIGYNNVTEVPTTILKNLAGSFALLVDARLRAYITILARHGKALSESPQVPEENREEATRAVERKLAGLLDIGSRMTIDNMVTNFHPRPKLGITSDVGDGIGALMIPLVMSAVLDITIPKVDSGHERVTVSLQAAGAISGTSRETKWCVLVYLHRSHHTLELVSSSGVCASGSTLLKSVCMELDTNQLMLAMVEKAAKVGKIVLDHVNKANFHVEYTVPDPAMALPIKRKCQEIANVADPRLPVVSPDHCAMLPPTGPSPLTLDADGVELTPECCASIVDCAIGEINDDFLAPLSKKMKHSPSA